MTGSGTLADPYIIYDVDDLQAMKNDLSAYYELHGDIDASATSGWNAGAGFDPIGDNINDFTGRLDGKSYKITNLTINRPASDYQALIGSAKPSTTGYIVRNLGLEGGSVTGDDQCAALVGSVEAQVSGCTIENCYSDLTITGDMHTGGLIGRITDVGPAVGITVSDCYCTGDVSGGTSTGGLIGRVDTESTIDSCYATGTVTVAGVFDHAGGLIGYFDTSSIRDCYATGAVSGGDDYVGGLIGRALTVQELQRCYATGDVVATDDYAGGLVGRLDMDAGITCQNCYARGDVTGDQYVGGFTGYLHTDSIIDDCYSTGVPTGSADVGGFCGINYGTITNCFWDTETSGEASSAGGTGKTTAQMQSKTTFRNAGWNFKTVWNMLATVNSGYPCLCNVTGSCPIAFKGNPNIDQLIYQHVERMGR